MPETAKLSITKDQVAEYLAAEEERKALEQKARAIKRRCDALTSHFKAALEEQGKTSLVRHGSRISLVEGRPSVAWKDAYIAAAGPLAADEMLNMAERPLRVVVQPA